MEKLIEAIKSDQIIQRILEEPLLLILFLVAVYLTTSVIIPSYLKALRQFVETRKPSSIDIKRFDQALEKLRTEIGEEKSKRPGLLSLQLKNTNALNLTLQELLDRKLSETNRKKISSWSDALERTSENLYTESERLRSRSTTNLTIGLALSGISALVLILAVFLPPEINPDDRWASMAEVYLPRAGLVLLFQLSSAFFLRLHAANEADLKQNKNELQNIDHKIAAVMLAASRENTEVVENFLVQTERNFVLEKGQRFAASDNEISMQTILDAVKALSSKSSA